jgi:ubiquinone biosynthesis protein Coq4
MNRWRLFRELLRVKREGRYFGDLVLLKNTVFPGSFEPTPELAQALVGFERPPAWVDMDFSKLPPGSFGAAYDAFMRANGLSPFRFSGRYDHLIEDLKLIALYSSVHDLYHVLTGYDTSLAGEAGVWGFVKGQGISPQADRAVTASRWIFPLLAPWSWRAIREASDEGYALGRAARQILTMDFAAELPRPLDEVRARYHVGVAKTARFIQPA